MRHRRFILIFLFVLIIVSALGIFMGVRQGEDDLGKQEPGSSASGSPMHNLSASVLPPSEGTEQEGQKDPLALRRAPVLEWSILESNDTEIQRLQEFIDNDDKESILAQAEFLVVSDDPVRRHAVIRAAEWANNPETGRLLLPLLQDSNSDIAIEASDAVGHILDTIATQVCEDPETNELEVAEDIDLEEIFDFGVEALSNCSNEEQCEDFMLRISTLDPKLSLPILLETLENGQDWQHELSLTYIDIVTNNEGVTNREEAILWLMKQQESKSEE